MSQKEQQVRGWFQEKLVQWNVAVWMYTIAIEREFEGWLYVVARNHDNHEIYCYVRFDVGGSIVHKGVFMIKEPMSDGDTDVDDNNGQLLEPVQLSLLN